MNTVSYVMPNSPAERAGIKAGMSILNVNGRPVRDIIDWKFALSHPVMRIVVQEGNEEHTYRLRHDSGAEIGIEFSSPTLDPLKVCKNNCLFCFVKQMPPKQRQSLYIKDDDYRLSLIYGSFVTLTNITEADFARIETEQISPIYVSIHTTNPELRLKIMQNPNAMNIMNQLHRLIAAGISIHAQLVLVPGLNDGEELVRSLDDLTSLYPGVESIAIVPVGLTGFREDLPELSGFNCSAARQVLDITTHYSQRFKRRYGRSIVYAADEFYILAKSTFPSNSYYDEYPQLENGVGISRLFIDSFRHNLPQKIKRFAPCRHVLWITGESSAFMLRQLQHELNSRTQGLWADVLVVKNNLFGGQVTVTGLLGGRDIAVALEQASVSPNTLVLLPDITLREGKFLDNISIDELCAQFKDITIQVCPTTGEDLVNKTLEERNEH